MNFKRVLITGGSGFIGTNLVAELLRFPNISITNVDLLPPKIVSHDSYWKKLDIRNASAISDVVSAFRPDAVIHLAARTDLDGRDIADYSTNTDGTLRLIEALGAIGFAGPAVLTSSMYVCRPGYHPTTDNDFQPHTVYGESKAIGERMIREANIDFPWVIVRPTSIWGPWFGIPYIDFFKLVLSGRYVNISDNSTKKTYGFVGNTVAQIIGLLNRFDVCASRVIYLGDWPPYVINEWADEIAAFVPYKVPQVPRLVLKSLALIGDALNSAGMRFPMSSFRLRNMTTDNVHNLCALEEFIGSTLPYTRQEGNELTVEWLRTLLPNN